MSEKWIVSAKRTDSEFSMENRIEECKVNIPRFIFDTAEQAEIFIERAKSAEQKAEDELDTPEWDDKYAGKFEERHFFEGYVYVKSDFKLHSSSEFSDFKDMNLIHITNAENVDIKVLQNVVTNSQYEPENGEVARVMTGVYLELLVDDEKFEFYPKQEAYEELQQDTDKGYVSFMTVPMVELIPDEYSEYRELFKEAFIENILTSNPINIPLREKAPRLESIFVKLDNDEIRFKKMRLNKK